MIIISNDFKKLILEMPQVEKDKMLLRFIAKDPVVLDQLWFKLREGGDSDLEIKKDSIKKAAVKRINFSINNNWHTPGILLMEFRQFSGEVNYYKTITKDRVGEVELRLYLMTLFFEHTSVFFKEKTSKNETLRLYFVSKLKQFLPLYAKLEEDFQYDFKENFNTLLQKMYETALASDLMEVNIPQVIN